MIEMTSEEVRKRIVVEFRHNRGKALTGEYLRQKIFGKEDNLWVVFCQRVMIGRNIIHIRDETNIYIFNIRVNGNRGYKVIETTEEFGQIITKYRNALLSMSLRLNKIKRDMLSGEYIQRVERFYRNGVAIKK